MSFAGTAAHAARRSPRSRPPGRAGLGVLDRPGSAAARGHGDPTPRGSRSGGSRSGRSSTASIARPSRRRSCSPPGRRLRAARGAGTGIKIYAVVRARGRAPRASAIAVAAILLVTAIVLPWASLDRAALRSSTDARALSRTTTSIFGNPIAHGHRRRRPRCASGSDVGLWLAVPVLWPSTQPHYLAMTVPMMTPSSLAIALADPRHPDRLVERRSGQHGSVAARRHYRVDRRRCTTPHHPAAIATVRRRALMRILVTGAAGFINGYLVPSCSRPATRSSASTTSASTAGWRSRTTTIRATGSSRATPRTRRCMRELAADCDQVVAAAAMIGGISYFHEFAYDLLAENERILASTFDAAIAAHRDGHLERIVVVSSSMVYESATVFPTPEGAQLTSPPPISTYGFQKLASEYFAKGAWEQYQLPYTIVRPFNCVGIGERRALRDTDVMCGNVKLALSHVVPDLVLKVLKGQDPLHILGEGTQVRHYTYGGDLAHGIRLRDGVAGGRQRGLQPVHRGVHDGARAGRGDLAQDPRPTAGRSATSPIRRSSTTSSSASRTCARRARSSASRRRRRSTRCSTRSSRGSAPSWRRAGCDASAPPSSRSSCRSTTRARRSSPSSAALAAAVDDTARDRRRLRLRRGHRRSRSIERLARRDPARPRAAQRPRARRPQRDEGGDRGARAARTC